MTPTFPKKADGTIDWATVAGYAIIAFAVIVAAKHASKIPLVGSTLAKLV